MPSRDDIGRCRRLDIACRATTVSSRNANPLCSGADSPCGESAFATFSIVAFDPATGDLGIKVASRVFGVGNHVPWAKRASAVATQAAMNGGYGQRVGTAAARIDCEAVARQGAC